ncbi:MAG: hypothetical protein HY423_16765 [Candidatus Lambdaproteobacteria bacterium]|nr:hypothetical protein [Candidatus Lambdaproteobacteria bacterium]
MTRDPKALEALERALRAAYRRAPPEAPPVPVEAIMARVRRSPPAEPAGDPRFLGRFVLAAAVVAGLIVGSALWRGVPAELANPGEAADPVAAVLTVSLGE